MSFLWWTPLHLLSLIRISHNAFCFSVSSWVFTLLCTLLDWSCSFGWRCRCFLLCTPLMLGIHWQFTLWICLMVPLIRAVTRCTRLTLGGCILLLKRLLSNICEIESPIQWLLLRLFCRIAHTAWLSLIYWLFAPWFCTGIWTWADKCWALWIVSRFLTVPAVFDSWICSVLWFTDNNLIIIYCSWPLITFSSPLVLNIAPCTMSSTCSGICRLLPPVIFEDQLILNRSSKSILLFWV